MHETIRLAARTALSLAILATLSACRVEADGDADLDGDVEQEPDGSLECCAHCGEFQVACGDICVEHDDPRVEMCADLEGCACPAGRQCAWGGEMCDGVCVDFAADMNNCGGCGYVCPDDGLWACNYGCVCADGYEVCNGVCCPEGDGCEYDFDAGVAVCVAP